MFIASGFFFSFVNTSSRDRDSHSSSSDNFAIRAPSVVNAPSSFFFLMTLSFLLSSSAVFMAKNGTAFSSLFSSVSSASKPASACSMASIFAREMAIAALARSSCFAMSAFPALSFDTAFSSLGFDSASSSSSFGFDAASFSSVDFDAIRHDVVGEVDSVILPTTGFDSNVCGDRGTKEETGAMLIECSNKCDSDKINARPILLQDIVDDVFVDIMIMDDGIGMSDEEKGLLLECRLLYKLFSSLIRTMESYGVCIQ